MGLTQQDKLQVRGCELRLTCSACPEQYDVFQDGHQIGYLRLRGGWFRADYGGCGGETVFEAYPNGDGRFEDDERPKFLSDAVCALLEEQHKRTAQ